MRLRRKKYAKVRSLPFTFLLLLGLHGCADCMRAPTHVARTVATALHLGATLVIGPVRRVGGSPSQGVAVRSLCGVLLLRLLRPNNAAATTREQRSRPRPTGFRRQQAAPEASR